MSLFNKNPNETAYVGGKKHWTDVIKNSGAEDILIWRQPEEDFNTNSTLVVMPGEEAIFIKGGTIEQVFEKGTYKLSTENYPFISRLRNAFSGGISTFNCVVYFVRKADSKELRWGTETPIQVRDKVHNIRTEAKVRGIYKVRIENPSVFLEKLVGDNVQYRTQYNLDEYFEGTFQGIIKSAVSKYLNSLEQELIGLDAHMDELSKEIEPHINEAVFCYGLKCVSFSLVGLDIDTTKYDIIDNAQLELISKLKAYQGDKAGLEILGDDWLRVHGVDILKDVANNPNSGGTAAAGAGMGLGLGAAGVFSSIAQQVFSPIHKDFYTQQPVDPIQDVPSGRFKQKSAAQSANGSTNTEDPVVALRELKSMLAEDLITQAEYDAKKDEILSRM